MGGPLSLAPQKEENVITEALIRQCIQTGSPKQQPKEGGLDEREDADKAQAVTQQQQQQTISFKDIQHLAFGFRHIVEIDHLHGLVNLKKLQLDNNCLTKIKNLDHLVCKAAHVFVLVGGCVTIMDYLAGQLDLAGSVLQQHQQAGRSSLFCL
ncbi:axoneme assembly [Trebouxia sp. C0010 RCD-2024]